MHPSCYGSVAILGSLISLMLLIVVPLFSLENDMWRRADNPHTLANVCLCAVIGIAAIIATRSADRVRLWLDVTTIVVFVVYGLYDLGLLHA